MKYYVIILIYSYIANQMEEEEEENRYNILQWALGDNWKSKMSNFMHKKDKLFERMDYRGIVNKNCCECVSLYVYYRIIVIYIYCGAQFVWGS